MLYITKLTSVFFSGLLESVHEFQRAFKDDVNSSSGAFSWTSFCGIVLMTCLLAFVVWAEEQLLGFVGQLTQQLANSKGLSTVAECVDIAKQHCAKVLLTYSALCKSQYVTVVSVCSYVMLV